MTQEQQDRFLGPTRRAEITWCQVFSEPEVGSETALEQLGPAGAAETEASQEFLLSRCLSIAGGTTQILLTQVAERVLGLPR